MIGDRDLLEFRQGYYDLFVSLLWKEPAGDLLAALGEGLAERIGAARDLQPLLAEGWEEIGRVLADTSEEPLGERVAEEYTSLFIGPPGPEVSLYESAYLTGRLMDRPLATVRSFLGEIGIQKQEGFAEPEDFLAFELEIMRRLIARQRSAGDANEEDRWMGRQADFLKRHLLVWAPAAACDLESAMSAAFYRGVAKLLRAFLAFEQELFRGWGPELVPSLQQARQSLAGEGEWKGPLFDISAPA